MRRNTPKKSRSASGLWTKERPATRWPLISPTGRPKAGSPISMARSSMAARSATRRAWISATKSDGWYYGGSCWMNALALAAGVPAAGQLSSHPYSGTEAFRAKVEHILSVLDDRGVPRYGYNQSGLWVDDILARDPRQPHVHGPHGRPGFRPREPADLRADVRSLCPALPAGRPLRPAAGRRALVCRRNRH